MAADSLTTCRSNSLKTRKRIPISSSSAPQALLNASQMTRGPNGLVLASGDDAKYADKVMEMVKEEEPKDAI